MKAIGYHHSLPINHPDALVDVDIPQPIATGRDLLVKVQSIAVNPADYKVRLTSEPRGQAPKILGWDAVGEVIATGERVTQFHPGDLVYYAGDITRQGSNAEYQLVDERIVGVKPKSLSHAEAAALPLTTITAWELLFEHLGIKQQPINTSKKSDEIILVVGAAGGVGSMLIQLAKTLTGATVIATASRDRSQAWVKKLGADFVVDHTQSLTEQIAELGLGGVTHVASLNSTETYFSTYAELLVPFGRIAIIDDPRSLDVTQLKLKSLSLHWEFMFARSMFNAVDLQAQGQLLSRVSDLVDQGYIQTTLGQHFGQVNAKNLIAAHAALEAGSTIGKIVLEGF